MKYLFLLLALIAIGVNPVHAQVVAEEVSIPAVEHSTLSDQDSAAYTFLAPDEVETTRAYQSEVLRIRSFDEDKWKKIVHGVNYTEEGWEDIRVTPAKPWGGVVVRVLAYAIILGAIILLLYYVIRYVSFDLKIERTMLESEDLERPVDNIEILDIARLLDQAKCDRNYKLAIRLYYLDLLKKLNEQGAIVWKKDKTNRDYLAELFSANFFFDEIRRLTLSYEAVWYGDHNLRSDSFDLLSTQFEKVRLSIDNRVKA